MADDRKVSLFPYLSRGERILALEKNCPCREDLPKNEKVKRAMGRKKGLLGKWVWFEGLFQVLHTAKFDAALYPTTTHQL